jgi:hypothetical protein
LFQGAWAAWAGAFSPKGRKNSMISMLGRLGGLGALTEGLGGAQAPAPLVRREQVENGKWKTGK